MPQSGRRSRRNAVLTPSGRWRGFAVIAFVTFAMLVLAWTQVTRITNRATQVDFEAHCRDFPDSPLARWRHGHTAMPHAGEIHQ